MTDQKNNVVIDKSVTAQDVVSEASMWMKVKPTMVEYEDAMGPLKVKKTWEKIYSESGHKSVGEEEKAGVRLAVYVYGCLNGASKESDFAAEITTYKGKTFAASVIAKACGEKQIRRFFRGCMDESYKALKGSAVMEDYPRFVAKAASLGVAAEVAFAMADWFKDCSLLTPLEVKAHEIAAAYGLERAKRARMGRDVSAIEKQRINDTLKTQGAVEKPESVVLSSW